MVPPGSVQVRPPSRLLHSAVPSAGTSSAGITMATTIVSALTKIPVRKDVAMTGEIDTHGRVTVVGGLDVKLEYAAGAGCRTVLIPRENLRGPGGIERFPEPLKRELQVLSFEVGEFVGLKINPDI